MQVPTMRSRYYQAKHGRHMMMIDRIEDRVQVSPPTHAHAGGAQARERADAFDVRNLPGVIHSGRPADSGDTDAGIEAVRALMYPNTMAFGRRMLSSRCDFTCVLQILQTFLGSS